MALIEVMRTRTLALTACLSMLLVAAPVRAGGADPLSSLQWNLRKVKAPKAWSIAKGAGVVIAVVDTGVDLGHPDLAAKIVQAPGNSDVVDSDAEPQDENGHGTHVAGIAAAVTRNGKGVAGVAPRAKIMPIRVLDADGSGTASDVAAGIRLADRAGADIINLSLEVEGGGLVGGFFGGGSEEVQDAIGAAVSRGVIVVVAAGNQGQARCNQAAQNVKVLCVGALDRRDRLASFSNYDEEMEASYLVAPGGDGESCASDVTSTILRTVPSQCSDKRGYEAFSGTSMAAPHVSGVAALLLSKGLAAGKAIRCITSTSVDLGPPGRDGTFGYGRVDALRAVDRC